MRSAATQTSEDQPAYNDEGVDLTLIRWTLSMTPAERLQVLQDFADSITRMRRGADEA